MRKFLVTTGNAVESIIEGVLAVSLAPLERVEGHFGLICRGNKNRRVHIVIGGGSGHEPLFLGAVGPGMADGAIAGAVFAAPNPRGSEAAIRELRTRQDGAGSWCDFNRSVFGISHCRCRKVRRASRLIWLDSA